MLEPDEMEERRQNEWERHLAGRPLCDDCGWPIQTEYCVRKDNGAYICWDCLDNRRYNTAEKFDWGDY